VVQVHRYTCSVPVLEEEYKIRTHDNIHAVKTGDKHNPASEVDLDVCMYVCVHVHTGTTCTTYLLNLKEVHFFNFELHAAI